MPVLPVDALPVVAFAFFTTIFAVLFVVSKILNAIERRGRPS